jgi:hypothetical protein
MEVPRHYSTESIALQKTPWVSIPSNPRSLAVNPNRARRGRWCSGDGDHRRRGPRAGKDSGSYCGLVALLVAEVVEFDGDPRWRRRGRRRRRCSGGERRPRSYAREPVSHGEHVRTTNWKNRHWIGGNRRRPRRRRRGRTPASVGEARWSTREPMNGSNSFRVMMWCWLRCCVGVEGLGSSCPR